MPAGRLVDLDRRSGLTVRRNHRRALEAGYGEHEEVRMNKREMVADVAGRTGYEPAVVAEIVNATIASIVRTVSGGEKVVLQGFGSFVRQARARRVARDIGAGTRVTVPATHVPAFHPGTPFREAVVARRRRRAPAAKSSRTSSRAARRS
jgi:nucleoid DNA-binding protein